MTFPRKLTFDIEQHEEGWSAQCREVPGIISGGLEKNSTENDWYPMIEDAIIAAMGIEITLIPPKTTKP